MTNKESKVRFPVEVDNADNCICSACHHIGRVIKLKLPGTIYDKDNMVNTYYVNYWICFNCREKLMKSLMWGENDEN